MKRHSAVAPPSSPSGNSSVPLVLEATMRVLVTGATGYIGGRLVPRLLEAGHAVRCFAREPARLAGRFAGIELAGGDIFDRESLLRALEGIDVAFYLVHSMSNSPARLRP